MYQCRILVSIVYLCILTYKMFISTIDYRRCVQRFPQDLYRLLPFNPLDCFAIHFETILIQFICVSGFWSPIYPAMASILHWQTAKLKCLNKGMLTLRDLELPALPYVASITTISLLPECRLYYAHEIVRWSCGNVICHSQKYMRDHWVSDVTIMIMSSMIIAYQ